MKTLIPSVITSVCCVQLAAQSPGMAVREIDRVLPSKAVRDAVCGANAAAMVFRDTVSRSEAGVAMLCGAQSRPVEVELGDGYRDFSIGAESYTRLGKESVVWGNAAFTTGVTRNVRWADCIDYERVAPYVLGDNVGGDLSRREYTFKGGYAVI
ncbi:MAG: hypothetical protein K2K72_05705, partial [Duncaniella sp.]|nr:hypothetical protein [Duncaniella sp.]